MLDESAFFDRDQARFVTGIYTAAIPSDGVNSVLSIELGQMVAGVSYVCICVCADGRVDVKTVGRGDEDDDDEVDAAHANFPLHEAPGRRRAKSCNVCVRVLLVSSTALERRANR